MQCQIARPNHSALIWELLSGRVAKYFCDKHSLDASPQPYRIAKLTGYNEEAKAATEED